MKNFFLMLSAFARLCAEPADEEAVYSRLKIYYQTFKSNDVKQIEAFWTEDAQLNLIGIGQDLKGKEAIAKRMLERYNQNPGSVVHIKSVNIKFPNQDKAEVTGWVQFEKNGIIFEERAGKLELVKKDGVWLLKEVEEISKPIPNGKEIDFPLSI